jgi:signal transduction histidine kinase
MAMTTLVSHIEVLEHSMQESGLRRHVFEKFLDSVKEASSIAVRNLERSANLINSFKKVSVDKTAFNRSLFTVKELIDNVLAEQMSKIKSTRCKIEIEIVAVPQIQMNSFPEALGDILYRLIENAIVHSFAQSDHGLIVLFVELTGETSVRIIVKDNGVGIAEEYREKIFDPFFTTRLGQGTSGLGLHIAHNSAVHILGGNLALISQSGDGCAFAIDLPLVAPE